MIIWQQSCGAVHLSGTGNQALLTRPMTAFFASRQCSGAAIRSAMDWALVQGGNRTDTKNVVISGFHSPLEQSVLTILLEAKSPAVVMLARAVEGARLPTQWLKPIENNVLAVVSVNDKPARLTSALAKARNKAAAQLAANIIIADVSVNGALAMLLVDWRTEGRDVTVLSSLL